MPVRTVESRRASRPIASATLPQQGAPESSDAGLGNADIAERLELVAALLEEQGANRYRVQAWRNGAATIRALGESVAGIIAAEGTDGLDRLPGIGSALASAIAELTATGRLRTLERLRGRRDPVALLASVPGVGATLAMRVHDELGIESLEALETAAHDGTLAGVEGFGAKRVAGIVDALASRLKAPRGATAAGSSEAPAEPTVDELLDVDREYRERAAAGELPTIAPRRFNPSGERWLPVLHTRRGARRYTALFSNTALAHRTRRTRDWVVLNFDDGRGEHQCTAVTAPRGPLAGRRIVRGRERECITHYRLATAAPSARRYRSRKAPTRRSYSAGV